MPRPIIPLLIALATGIICSNLCRVPDALVQIILTITFLGAVVGYVNEKRRFFYSSILLSFLLLGILRMNVYQYPHPGNNHIKNFVNEQKITVEGLISDNPQMSREKTELLVSVFRIIVNGNYHPASGRVLLTVHEPSAFSYGDVIRFRSRLRAPHNFNNPGGFDYEQHLRFRGVSVRGFIDDPTAITILRKGMGNILRMPLEHYRTRIRTAILDVTPETEGKIIQAMILGNQVEIPQDVMEKFNRTGTTHIIAISGFNIGIVAIFSLFLARLFLKKSEYLLLRWNMTDIATLLTILVIIFYTLLAGAGISVIRASIMVVIFMAAILLNRTSDLFNALALAALLILLISPFSLFDISFQLSFTAVTFLLFLTPKLVSLFPQSLPLESPILTSRDGITHYAKKASYAVMVFFFASLTATLATLPLIIFYFNRVSLVTLAANFVVVPILGIITIPLCMFIIVAVPISTSVADMIIQLCAFLVRISLALVDWLSAFPWSSVFVSTPSLLEISAFYLLLVSAGFCLDLAATRKKTTYPRSAVLWKILTVFLVLFFVLDCIHLSTESTRREELSVTAIDVGQGTATLIRFPGGKQMLVDGGGFFNDTFDIGKYVIAPFLWHERITQIDTITLSHPHPDHLQGLLFILDNFRVREVWTNGQWVNSPLYDRFKKIIHDRGITLRVVSAMTPAVEVGGVTIRILHPPASLPTPRSDGRSSRRAARDATGTAEGLVDYAAAPDDRSRTRDDLNDRSLVIRLSFGRQTFLLPGDISGHSELSLVRSNVDLSSDVLFAPHHGGFRSSTVPFLEKVKPGLAIISCGADNVFGFPHQDVLQRFEQFKSRVYRTDLDGAVTILTDGTGIRVSAFHHRGQ
jgi:competence protein ComEC